MGPSGLSFQILIQLGLCVISILTHGPRALPSPACQRQKYGLCSLNRLGLNFHSRPLRTRRGLLYPVKWTTVVYPLKILLWGLPIFLHSAQVQSQKRAPWYSFLTERAHELASGPKSTETMLQNEQFYFIWVAVVLYRVRRWGEKGGDIWVSLMSNYSFCLRSALVSPVYCHPNSQQRRWQFLRSCQSRISLSLALKNLLRKRIASSDIKNRHCFVRCSHRRWAVLQGPLSFEKERWKSCSPLAGCQSKSKRGSPPACRCWRLKSGCEDGGRNLFIGIKLGHFNTLFTLNFFLSLEGCNQIKAIILWNNLKLSKKVWKKIALIKLLPRVKRFTIIITLILLKDVLLSLI